eukprot:COSAG02_NODE_365_length_23749_cov_13.908584_3_plen_76_part_00
MLLDLQAIVKTAKTRPPLRALSEREVVAHARARARACTQACVNTCTPGARPRDQYSIEYTVRYAVYTCDDHASTS